MLDVLINSHSTPPMVTIYSADVSPAKMINFRVNPPGDGPILEPVEVSPFADRSAFTPVGPQGFRDGEFEEVSPEILEKLEKAVGEMCHPRVA